MLSQFSTLIKPTPKSAESVQNYLPSRPSLFEFLQNDDFLQRRMTFLRTGLDPPLSPNIEANHEESGVDSYKTKVRGDLKG